MAHFINVWFTPLFFFHLKQKSLIYFWYSLNTGWKLHIKCSLICDAESSTFVPMFFDDRNMIHVIWKIIFSFLFFLKEDIYNSFWSFKLSLVRFVNSNLFVALCNLHFGVWIHLESVACAWCHCQAFIFRYVNCTCYWCGHSSSI